MHNLAIFIFSLRDLQNVAISILSFVFVLGVLIFVHELGHFLAAKFFGIRVETFSLGFGKRLVGFRRGDTDYRVSLLPVGGYVKMAGEYPTDESVGAPDELLSKPRWQRLIVGAAGATMNLIMAVLILAGIFMLNNREPLYLSQPVVVGSMTDHSAATAAGIQIGDRVVEIGKKANPTWQDVEDLSLTPAKDPVAMTVKRHQEEIHLSVTPQRVPIPDTGEQISDFGIRPAIPVQVRNLVAGFPGLKAGLQEGDLIIQMEDRPITKFEDFEFLNDTIHKSVGKPLRFVIQRGDKTFIKDITPIMDDKLGYGRIGFSPSVPSVKMNLGPIDAARKSIQENYRKTVLTFFVLGQLVTGKTSPKTLVGPIGIFKVTGEAAKASSTELFQWMAFISLQLGIFNLLPIPVLDGGMIFMLLIESALRRDINRTAKERIIYVGALFLMVLMGYVIYNDVLRSTPWGKPSESGSTQTNPATK